MSLIMDALKGVQQLRNGSRGVPILKCPGPDMRRKSSKKRWFLIGGGLISLCILFFIHLKPISSPLPTQPNRALASIEKKAPIPKVEKAPQEPSGLPKDAEPTLTQTTPSLKLRSVSDLSPRGGTGKGKIEQPLPEKEPSIEEGGEERLIKQMVQERKVKRAVQPKKSPIEKGSSSTSPASLKEDVLPKSTELEQGVGKDYPLASDILNQFNLGVYFYNQREISKAIQAYQKVIEMDPAYIEAYNNLGIVYQEMGDFENALKSYQKSVEINPRYEKAYNNLGIVFYLKEHYEEALEAFQKALTLNPNNGESYINCGILFKKKGEWDKAIESYQKALANNPLHGETHYNIALLYEQLENLELAIGHYQTFIQLSSKSHPELVSKVKRHLNNLMKARKGK